MTLKIKDKQIIWTKLYFRQFYNEKIWITGVFSRIRVTQKDRIRIRNTGLLGNLLVRLFPELNSTICPSISPDAIDLSFLF